MADYTLYYWPIAFRGQFVRAVLAHVGAGWTEAGVDDLLALKDAEPDDQLVPHMGPPVLIDHAAGLSLAQTPAILGYLGDRYGLIPDDPALAALTAKLTQDAMDVLYEMTLFHGHQMWTQAAWDDYRPRLARWMAIFESHGHRHGLTADAGFMLGSDAPGLADLVTHILWGVMTEKLPALRPMLDDNAPTVAALSDRIGQLPAQVELRTRSEADYGDAWCSGQIEASLRAVL